MCFKDEKTLKERRLQKFFGAVAKDRGKAKEEEVMKATYIAEHHKNVIYDSLLHKYPIREVYTNTEI